MAICSGGRKFDKTSCARTAPTGPEAALRRGDAATDVLAGPSNSAKSAAQGAIFLRKQGIKSKEIRWLEVVFGVGPTIAQREVDQSVFVMDRRTNRAQASNDCE
jgi:hypothetical protein